MTTEDRHPHKPAAVAGDMTVERYASAVTWHWDRDALLVERYGDLRELERKRRRGWGR